MVKAQHVSHKFQSVGLDPAIQLWLIHLSKVKEGLKAQAAQLPGQGPRPKWAGASTGAFAFSRNLTASRCPCSAARCSMLFPGRPLEAAKSRKLMEEAPLRATSPSKKALAPR